MPSSRITHPLVAVTLIILSLGAPAGASEPVALFRVDLDRPVAELGLPVHALLQDARGQDYALVLALPSAAPAGRTTVVDPSTGTAPGWVIALERRPGARRAAAARFHVLMDDGRRIVLRDAPGLREELGALGFDLTLLSPEPLVFRPVPLPSLPTLSYDQRVADMMARVLQGDVFSSNGGLSGESPVTVGGDPYTIQTRHTTSGVPIQKATQYVYEFMQDLGLTVSYHQWSSGSHSGRNVVGEKVGASTPDEIVLVTAHLDDMPSGGIAPGADDNVPPSGTVEGMGDFDCSPGGQSVFGDVPPDDPGGPFIHYLASTGISGGCGGGLYCPADAVTRWQMAVFLSAATTDPDTIPGSGTVPGKGDFDCTEGGTSVFDDVPPGDPGCRFIHHMAVEGITAGCSPTSYCPGRELTRAEMAVFMDAAFGLELTEGAAPQGGGS